MTIVTGDNIFANTTYIVDPTKGRGTHQTIADAISDASSGETIGIRPGTYTENFTLKSNVNIYALGIGGNSAGDVLVEGKITIGTCERCLIKGIRFTNNGDVILEDTGSSTDSINFSFCTFLSDGSNNMFESSNTSKNFFFYQCVINSGAGSKVVNSSGGGFTFRHCIMNAGASTISTLSAGAVNFYSCIGVFPFQTTGTANFTMGFSTQSTSNQMCIDHQGAAQAIMQVNSLRTNGTAVAINVGAAAAIISTGLDINTANPTPITGSGTFNYDSVGWIQNPPNTIVPSSSFGSKRIRSLELDSVLSQTYGGTGGTVYRAGGTKDYYFKASDFDALETNFAPLNQDNGSTARILSRAFDDTTEEFVNFSLKVPSNINTSGTVTFRVWMYAATAVASRFVQLTFDHRAVDNSESWDGAYTSEDSGDLAIDGTQDDITEGTWTETVSNLGWAANDYVMCRLSRIAPSGTNLSGDLYIVGFAVEIPRS